MVLIVSQNVSEPLVLQCFRAGIPLCLVHCQQLLNQILSTLMNWFEFFVIKGVYAALYRIVNLHRVVSVKGKDACQYHIHDDSEAPAITLFIVVTFEYLRSQVIWSTDHCPKLCF